MAFHVYGCVTLLLETRISKLMLARQGNKIALQVLCKQIQSHQCKLLDSQAHAWTENITGVLNQ